MGLAKRLEEYQGVLFFLLWHFVQFILIIFDNTETNLYAKSYCYSLQFYGIFLHQTSLLFDIKIAKSLHSELPNNEAASVSLLPSNSFAFRPREHGGLLVIPLPGFLLYSDAQLVFHGLKKRSKMQSMVKNVGSSAELLYQTYWLTEEKSLWTKCEEWK